MPCASIVLIGIAFPSLPANALFLCLSDRRQFWSKSSGVFFVSCFLGAGFLEEGVFRARSVSDSDMEVSHSNSISAFSILLFFSLLNGFCLPVGSGFAEVA